MIVSTLLANAMAARDLPLPGSFRTRLDRSVRRPGGGAAVIGGTPRRRLQLSVPGAGILDRLTAGVPVGEAGPGAAALARRLLDNGVLQPLPPPAGPDLLAGVTIVVPVRDRAADLVELLALLGSGVVVVDDGSVDGSGAVAAGAGAVVVRRDRAGGPAAARNAGLRQGDGPLVAFVDSDCRPEPGWLAAAVAHFADPSVAAAAPRVVAPGGGHGFLSAYERAGSPLDLGAEAGLVGPGRPVAYVPAAALIVRRDVLVAMGGFDESLLVGEDVDLVWRLVEAGWAVRYEPVANVTHQPRAGWAATLRRRFDYGTSAAPLARRHPGSLPAWRGPAWTAGAWALTAAGRPRAAAAVLLAAWAALARRLSFGGSGRLTPAMAATESARLIIRGHLAAGVGAATAAARPYAPVTLALALSGRRPVHRLAALALAARLATAWWPHRRSIDPARFAAARLADDTAYSLGVGWGCLRHRTAEPLRVAVTWRWGER